MSLSPNGDTAHLLNNVVVQNDRPEFLNVSPAGEAGEESPQSDSLPSAVDNKHHLDEIIPPTHPNRTIVLCFDGTGDQFSEDVRNTFFFKGIPADLSQNSQNSNIVQFFSMLSKDNKTEQMVYYQVCRMIWVARDRHLFNVLC